MPRLPQMECILLNVERADVERWEEMAGRRNMSLSDWVSMVCNAAELSLRGGPPDPDDPSILADAVRSIAGCRFTTPQCTHFETNYGATQCLRCGVALCGTAGGVHVYSTIHERCLRCGDKPDS